MCPLLPHWGIFTTVPPFILEKKINKRVQASEKSLWSLHWVFEGKQQNGKELKCGVFFVLCSCYVIFQQNLDLSALITLGQREKWHTAALASKNRQFEMSWFPPCYISLLTALPLDKKVAGCSRVVPFMIGTLSVRSDFLSHERHMSQITVYIHCDAKTKVINAGDKRNFACGV